MVSLAGFIPHISANEPNLTYSTGLYRLFRPLSRFSRYLRDFYRSFLPLSSIWRYLRDFYRLFRPLSSIRQYLRDFYRSFRGLSRIRCILRYFYLSFQPLSQIQRIQRYLDLEHTKSTLPIYYLPTICLLALVTSILPFGSGLKSARLSQLAVHILLRFTCWSRDNNLNIK